MIQAVEVIISGVLEKILFYNEENHYLIGELSIEKNNEKIIISGNLPYIQCGETLCLNGNWIKHPLYGQQFKINKFESTLPSCVYGIRQYLGSGLVKGIGKTYANKIVDRFGIDTFKIISEESAKLQEVPGIGKQRAKSIKKAWDDQKALRDIMIFLKTYGITNNQCIRLVQKYGNQAKELIESNPYILISEMRGIGFKSADKIALNLGFASDSELRVRAAIKFLMDENEDNGHTIANISEIKIKCTELLKIDSSIIEREFNYLLETKCLTIFENEHCQFPEMEKKETEIAKNIARIKSTGSSLPDIIIGKAIEWAQEKAGFHFAGEQTCGIQNALLHKLSIITGGPGTGKTTLLKALVNILKAKKLRITLAAPTGRAAQRMAETTQFYAQTIHRLLKFDQNTKTFTYSQNNPLHTDFVIIDEVSMLDTDLTCYLLNAIPSEAHVLFLGDINQLPSVGPGKILNDFIECGLFKVTYLQQVFRQAEESAIVTTAYNILNEVKQLPQYFKDLDTVFFQQDLIFIESKTPEDCIVKLEKLFEVYLKKWFHYFNPLTDIQVLVPMHKGNAGISNLNKVLQDVLNKEKKKPENKLQKGDKVIQTKNNYELNIFNGDLGFINNIDYEEETMEVIFEGRSVIMTFQESLDLNLAYTISIHKSQGSEFPVVIIPLLKQHFVMLQKNLIYTAITRGRKKVIILGDPSAYFIAIGNNKSILRQTGLRNKIQKLWHSD